MMRIAAKTKQATGDTERLKTYKATAGDRYPDDGKKNNQQRR
ncbi:MAG: hypothetical protein ACE5R6_20745 [Candidatus Heimdallarchaeota archaeon]